MSLQVSIPRFGKLSLWQSFVLRRQGLHEDMEPAVLKAGPTLPTDAEALYKSFRQECPHYPEFRERGYFKGISPERQQTFLNWINNVFSEALKPSGTPKLDALIALTLVKSIRQAKYYKPSQDVFEKMRTALLTIQQQLKSGTL